LNQKMLSQREVSFEIKKLKIATRNKVRSIVSSKEDESIRILNKLRKSSSIGELAQVEKAIKLLSLGEFLLPEIFPTKPQTSENYRRLCTFSLDKQLENLNYLVSRNFEKLHSFFKLIFELNNNIVIGDFVKADDMIPNLLNSCGYSHLLLRKSILITSNALDEDLIPNSDLLIQESGLDQNNSIVSCLIHCFQEEQDFLSIKRSIMNTKSSGDWNKYTRDILRTPFHPHAKDIKDLSELIQSNLQSSLIDAIISAKINQDFFANSNYPALNDIFAIINSSVINIDDIVSNYSKFDDPEDLFYQQSSAWFENDDVINYRLLQDHFYDTPDANYFKINDVLVNKIKPLISVSKIEDLSVINIPLRSHGFNKLQNIEKTGTITRSSIFNFIIHLTEGKTSITEESLVALMGITRGLDKTINIEYIKTLATNSDSDLSKIVLYLLVAKKSKNELNGNKLRRILQKRIIKSHDNELVNFLVDIAKVSPSISRFTYDVCIEDFISRLSRIIKSSLEITETRASLHKWMGEHTGEKAYFDRARNVIVDHQINRVKDQLDDHRIYADSTRFTEWMEDEVNQSLHTLLLILAHNDELASYDEPQLITILEKCYYEFCTNKFFGIASYLGRRIRHGTFKGHLFSDVIAVESRHRTLLLDPSTAKIWKQWKLEHENKIDSIVQDKLHIETSQKKHGFLNPHIKSSIKQDIAKACIKNILLDFKENSHIDNSLQLIVEYCWRITEVDLKNVGSYIKGQKQVFLNADLVSEIKDSSSLEVRRLAKDFSRDLQSQINEKVSTMYGWFQRPQSVAPKVSLGLLYKAVVAEVTQTFSDFSPISNVSEHDDTEIMGGAYHVIYDALYVIIYNAAKHSKTKGKVTRIFEVLKKADERAIVLTISSENKDCESDSYIKERIQVSENDDIDNAQLCESRSGIRKLYHLQEYNKDFSLDMITCENRELKIKISYKLGH